MKRRYFVSYVGDNKDRPSYFYGSVILTLNNGIFSKKEIIKSIEKNCYGNPISILYFKELKKYEID